MRDNKKYMTEHYNNNRHFYYVFFYLFCRGPYFCHGGRYNTVCTRAANTGPLYTPTVHNCWIQLWAVAHYGRSRNETPLECVHPRMAAWLTRSSQRSVLNYGAGKIASHLILRYKDIIASGSRKLTQNGNRTELRPSGLFAVFRSANILRYAQIFAYF
jgi:hypothetical protein